MMSGHLIAILTAALLGSPPAGRERPKPGASQPAESAPQQPLSDEEVRSKAEAWLGAIDRPIPAEQWKSLGPRAAAVLEPIASDPDQFPTRRAKALDGLAAAAPARAAGLAGKLARDENEHVVVRVAAIRAAGAVLSSRAAQSELRPVLKGRNAGLRGEAAEVLSRKGGCAAVREQAAQESTELHGSWKRALQRCGE